ncbi:MAG TPA: hypothetical protein G4N95_05140 [Anaerolineae bacterium]|nr:hypothetical protein [Anaerolineae bacterium]
MSKKKNKSKKKEEESTLKTTWISMRSGLAIITIVSILLVIWTVWKASTGPIGERILWGLAFGGSIWVIFLFALFINRLFRRRK